MTEPTVFDEIFDRLTPDRILKDPRATGEGVSVAVIDSGVERAVLEDKFHKLGRDIHPIDGAVFKPGTTAALPYDGRQSSPLRVIVPGRIRRRPGQRDSRVARSASFLRG